MRNALFAALAAVAAVSAAPAGAAEFEKYCAMAGFAAPLRQTAIIVDEQHIAPEQPKERLAENNGWRRFAGELLDMRRNGVARDFLPRERVTLLVARRDGGGLVRVFTGCLPFFSDEEKRENAKKSGSWKPLEDFFGAGLEAGLKKDAEGLQRALAAAFIEAARPEQASPAARGSNRDVMRGGIISENSHWASQEGRLRLCPYAARRRAHWLARRPPR